MLDLVDVLCGRGLTATQEKTKTNQKLSKHKKKTTLSRDNQESSNLKTTYTINRSQSAQIFCPGGSCGEGGVGFVSGAITCRKPATPEGTTPVSASS